MPESIVTPIAEIDRGVLDKTCDLLERSPLRAADALHIACALELGVDRFVTSDHRQIATARGAGLTVVNPEKPARG